MPSPTSKEALRSRFRSYRTGLDPASYQERSTTIVERLAALPALEQAGTVHIYWPVLEAGEIDTRPLIRRLREAGKRVALPRIIDLEPLAGGGPPEMASLLFDGEDHLEANEWGVHEPVGTESVPRDDIEVVVVPALGAGRNGHRIGYGGGFYDAFLRGLDVPRLCPVYNACLVDSVPVEPHDIPMTTIVTEDNILPVPA